MTDDFRTLCAELADELDAETGYTRNDGQRITHPSVARARAALAEGEAGPRLWTEGICGDGAALLRDGVMIPIEEIVAELNRGEQARAALAATPPRPVPVSERLNDAHLEEIARAFSDDPVEVAAFICGARWAEYKLKPGPAHAIATELENTDVQ